MFHVEIALPVIYATKDESGDQALLEPGDKWSKTQTFIISRAFTTKAKCHRWAYRHGGIEEHDAQLRARGSSAEFEYFQRQGQFRLRQTKDFPARTELRLVGTGTRELPDEAQKKSGSLEGSWRWVDSSIQTVMNPATSRYEWRHAEDCQCRRCVNTRIERELALREAAPGITPEQLQTLLAPGPFPIETRSVDLVEPMPEIVPDMTPDDDPLF